MTSAQLRPAAINGTLRAALVVARRTTETDQVIE
jgi:hypothetical protein